MSQDLSRTELFDERIAPLESVSVCQGSCLELLPTMESKSVDMIITSPPYCNRYDYTRTYALELAYLGVDELQLKWLRQALLSCTVENQPKLRQLRCQYDQAGQSILLTHALEAFESQEALQEVLQCLDRNRSEGLLNNDNVPRMVRNYFVEMAIVIFEFARLLKRGGRVIMVNDNVQYAGEEVPVDLILSDIAASAGLDTECIWTLGRGKGNSSQQMGVHGRNELRKCAYVWTMN
jgi:hypothetical protein